MKSEIPGECEQAVMATVEKIRSPALVGVDTKLSPQAAKAMANLIEYQAQKLDEAYAEARYNSQWSLFFFGLILCGELLRMLIVLTD